MRLATSSASNKHQTKLPTWPARPVYRLCPRPAAGITGMPAPRSTARIEGADGRRRNSRQLPGALRPGRRLRPFTQSLACSAARRRRIHDPRRATPASAAIRGAGADPLPRGGRRPPIRGPGWGARADRPRGSGGGIERHGEPSGGSGGRAKVAAALAERLLRSAGSGQQQRRI